MQALNRRRFLALGGAIVAMTSGCAGEPAASQTTQPRRGGRLRAAFSGGGAAEVLDPHETNLYVEIARAKAMFDKLADFGSDMSPRPRLAERWEPSADLLTWRITLRQADFHDGRPLRANDVLASYARIVEPGSTRRAKSTLSVIDLPNSRAIDERTVELRLTRPYGEFPNALATLGAYIVPEGTTTFDHPVGTGPFRFTSFEPGRTFLAEGNPDHWDGAPYLDELEIVVSGDEAARVNALLGKQIEYAHDLTPASARTHEAAGQIQIHRLPLSNFHGVVMKVDRPPFDRPGAAAGVVPPGRPGRVGPVGAAGLGRGLQRPLRQGLSPLRGQPSAAPPGPRPGPESGPAGRGRGDDDRLRHLGRLDRAQGGRPRRSATRPGKSGSTSTSGWATRTPTGPTSRRTVCSPATGPAGCPSSRTSHNGS